MQSSRKNGCTEAEPAPGMMTHSHSNLNLVGVCAFINMIFSSASFMVDAPWTSDSPALPPVVAAARVCQHCACCGCLFPHPRRLDDPNMGRGKERWRLYHPVPASALVSASISPAPDRNLGGKEERWWPRCVASESMG